MAKTRPRNPSRKRDRAPIEAPELAPRAPLFDVTVTRSGYEKQVLHFGGEDPLELTPPPSARRP
jgi:hypothetical protein